TAAYVTTDGVFVRDLASGDTRRITKQAGQGIALAPDGKHAAVSTGSVYSPDVPDTLDELDLATGARRKLADGVQPSYSPDGAWLAYVGDRALTVMRLDGGERRRLVELGD